MQNGPDLPRLSISSQEVIDNVKRLTQIYSQPNAQALTRRLAEDQKRDEQALIAKLSPCSAGTLESLREHLPDLNSEKLKNLLNGQLYNPAVLESALCVSEALFLSSPRDAGGLALNERIKEYIRNLHQIGGESAEGYAMTASFKDTPNLFVVKAPRNPEVDNLQHEAVVGIFGTNQLRAFNPNFAYIFGAFRCSPPLVDPETKEVVSWCLSNDNAVNYVVYENINPATALDDYVRTCTGEEFMMVYMQILYAIRKAVQLIGFTHFDLHTQNVLLREPPNGPGAFFGAEYSAGANREFISIPYDTERGIEYIKTKRIAMMIDYGFTHIVHQDKSYGKFGYTPYSIFPDTSWPYHDAYKLLMMSLRGALEAGNSQLIPTLTMIFRFFNQTDVPEQAVKEQFEVRYAFPYNERTKDLDFDMFIRYLRSICECSFIRDQPGDEPVLRCSNYCLTSDAVLQEIGGTGPVRAHTVLDLYDLMAQTQNKGKPTQTLLQHFDYARAMTTHLAKHKELLQQLQSKAANLHIFDVESVSEADLMNYQTMNLIRTSYIKIAELVDLAGRLELYHVAGEAIARLYSDQATLNYFAQAQQIFRTTIQPYLGEALAQLRKNDAILDAYTGLPDKQKLTERDYRLRWYWEGRRLFRQII
jgi:hypothetical protein